MTPKWTLKWTQNGSFVGFGDPWRAEEGFFNFSDIFDPILGSILRPLGYQNASKNQSKNDSKNDVGKVRK